MNPEERLAAFKKLGNLVRAIDTEELHELVSKTQNENPWFTNKSVSQALKGLATMLEADKLEQWSKNYELTPRSIKTVAVVMAGNIPLVGFHDLLSILIAGHSIQIKLSSKDTVLLRWIIAKLVTLEPRFEPRIKIVDQIKNYDAVIATGSDNAARYFEFYFKNHPHIIRKNRTSCAVITGFESELELSDLGKDVFSYFGLGCRNVSKLFVPMEYDFSNLLRTWEKYSDVMMHHKYHNNYDYQKSILLINNSKFLDGGYVLLEESSKLVSPISVLYYEYYNNWDEVKTKLASQGDKIQCIVGSVDIATVKPGSTQSPDVWDYADHVDTVKFLQELD
jgi:hypothetical protein